MSQVTSIYAADADAAWEERREGAYRRSLPFWAQTERAGVTSPKRSHHAVDFLKFPDARLLVFAKAPRQGHVKTRLIPYLSADEAARLHQRMVTSTLSRFAHQQICPVELCCAPDCNHPFFQQIAANYPVALRPQHGHDLGDRMAHAFDQLLPTNAPRSSETDPDRINAVVLIGTDCPVLQPGDLTLTIAALKAGVDAVIGPAEDGGYILIGLSRPEPRLFEDMPWGSDQVLSLTRSRLIELGWEWIELPTFWDIDRPADLKRLRTLPQLFQL